MKMRTRLLLFLLVLFAVDVLARVGGGGSYSGGGGSSSGGGSGGDGGGAELLFYLFRFLFWLTIHYPAIGIPVDIVVIYFLWKWFSSRQASGNSALLRVSTTGAQRGAVTLDALRRFDPNFSEITFTDFSYSLYGRAHHARGAGDVNRYAPYLSPAARKALLSMNTGGLTQVKGVIVGACKVIGVYGLDSSTVHVKLRFESNVTEVARGRETTFYLNEVWMLERKRDILSPPPGKAKADHCPRCGGALQTRTDGSCDYCGIRIENGAFQWYVTSIQLLTREDRGPTLTQDVPERGTDNPTIYQPGFAQKRAAISDWPAFELRVREIATELQDAWTARDWERVRPLETENLFQMHRYWIDEYKRQKLRNVVDDFTIDRVEPVKITDDAYYEAITVRLFAHGRDYTMNEEGRVVAGSNRSVRRWSEYWTLIRTKAAPTRPAACPNCGAPVAAGSTGICAYCGGKITLGEFEWILSRIDQDEAYAG